MRARVWICAGAVLGVAIGTLGGCGSRAVDTLDAAARYCFNDGAKVAYATTSANLANAEALMKQPRKGEVIFRNVGFRDGTVTLAAAQCMVDRLEAPKAVFIGIRSMTGAEGVQHSRWGKYEVTYSYPSFGVYYSRFTVVD